MMMRSLFFVVLLALCCTCSFVLADTKSSDSDVTDHAEPIVTEEAGHGGGGGVGIGSSGSASTSSTGTGGQSLEPVKLQEEQPDEPPEEKQQLQLDEELRESKDDSVDTETLGAQQKDRAVSNSQGTTKDKLREPADPSLQPDIVSGKGGKAASQANEQVVARTESGNNGVSNSGSEKNTVGSLTAEEPNANSEEQKSENAPTSPNENVTQGTNDAGNSTAVQIQGSTDKESEPENGTTPNTNEESNSTTTTTTTATTTLPPELTNNKKGDADSSSSISSSVWVR
ncbi:uncharacterized protein TM35_000561080, partial [Trypanosoma theileri]